MSEQDSAWVGVPSEFPMKGCAVCGSKTKSHGVAVEDYKGQFIPASDPDPDSTMLYPVCHTCYTEYDGSAIKVCRHLTDGRSKNIDDIGITPRAISTIESGYMKDPDERVRAVGDSSIEDLMDDIDEGDVVTLKSLVPDPVYGKEFDHDRKLAVVPTPDYLIENIEEVGGVSHENTLMSADSDSIVGGIVRNQTDLSFTEETEESPQFILLYSDEEVSDGDKLAIAPITEIEVVGTKDVSFEGFQK